VWLFCCIEHAALIAPHCARTTLWKLYAQRLGVGMEIALAAGDLPELSTVSIQVGNSAVTMPQQGSAFVVSISNS
jgi:hypothetical protein